MKPRAVALTRCDRCPERVWIIYPYLERHGKRFKRVELCWHCWEEASQEGNTT